ncbi:MAG: hypothetical protein ACJAR8_001455 [Bacteroidia bacterium]|jgi:uncharacterized protein YwgA|tara:strand:+ start:292 stop:657 length:366 start_codon:yes stop_codon:yes gene_type:complete
MNIIKKIVLWIIGLTITGTVLVILFALYGNYSSGERAGQVIKMSKKGYVFKTNEGQLNTGEIQQGIWNFSVKKSEPELLEKLRNAMNNGKRVTLHYDEKYVQVFFLGDTKYFVTKVEVLGE